MRCDDDGRAGGKTLGQAVGHQPRAFRIQCGRGLIGNDDLGFEDQRPRNGHPRGLACRKRISALRVDIRQPEPFEQTARPPGNLNGAG